MTEKQPDESPEVEVLENTFPPEIEKERRAHNKRMLNAQYAMQIEELRKSEAQADQECAKAKMMEAHAAQAEVVARQMETELEALLETIHIRMEVERMKKAN